MWNIIGGHLGDVKDISIGLCILRDSPLAANLCPSVGDLLEPFACPWEHLWDQVAVHFRHIYVSTAVATYWCRSTPSNNFQSELKVVPRTALESF